MAKPKSQSIPGTTTPQDEEIEAASEAYLAAKDAFKEARDLIVESKDNLRSVMKKAKRKTYGTGEYTTELIPGQDDVKCKRSKKTEDDE